MNMKKHSKLMIPGPVDVWEETLEALSEPVLPHYGDEFAPIYQETIGLLEQVFQTQNDIFILTAPGSGAVETCAASLFSGGEKVAAVSNGPFANRAIEILRAYQCQVIEVQDEWGKAGDLDKMRQTLRQHPDIAGIVVVANETGTGVRNPVRELAQMAHEHDIPIFVDAISAMGGYDLPVDEWELDLICTSSNKAMEIPPGLGIVSVNDRAWKIIEAKAEKARRGWYYNLSTWNRYREARAGGPASPTTMATSLIVALRASLKRIVEGETLAGHWARYAWAQQALRAGLRNIGFEMLVCDADASLTVTTFWKREDMENERELREFMAREHGYTLSAAWGPLTGKVLRVGHMGKASSPEYLIPCLLGIEDFVRRVKKEDVPVGASLVRI
jgi:aspartate aminotransferase-like enzyme